MSKKTATKRIIESGEHSYTVRLRGVRLSFPAIFEPRAFDETQEAKYSAVFLMEKDGDPEKNAAHVKKAMDAIIKSAFKGRHPGPTKVCLRDGAEKPDVDGYGDEVMFISASSRRAIPVVDRDRAPLTERDDRPYAGCYVNASIRLWAQDNKWGKRVNAQLRAIQFLRDGEPFGEVAADPEDEFEDVSTGVDLDSEDDIL